MEIFLGEIWLSNSSQCRNFTSVIKLFSEIIGKAVGFNWESGLNYSNHTVHESEHRCNFEVALARFQALSSSSFRLSCGV